MVSIKRTFQKDPYFGYILVLPLLIWVGATLVYPLIKSITLALQNVTFAGTGGEFIGLQNFRIILTSAQFWKSMGISIVWTAANVILQVILAFVAALALNQEFIGKKFVRNWIILPWVFPSVALATLGKWVLDPTLGLVNYLLLKVGFVTSPISFLGDLKLALYAVIVVNAWRWFPFFTVILLAAMQSVPKEIDEAAALDGASSLGRVWYIEIPSIMPVLKVVVLISSLVAANIFDTVWLLTRGGPNFNTLTLPLLVYWKGFQEYRMSHAVTISLMLFSFLILCTFLYFRYVTKKET